MKQSQNNGTIVGTLAELNLMHENKEITLDNGEKITCGAIVKKNYRNPALVINVDGSPVEIDLFACYEIKKDGSDDSNYSGRKTITEKYVEGETRVQVNATNLTLSEYAKDGENFSSYQKILGTNFTKITSTGVPEEDSAEGRLTGKVMSMVDESDRDGELTGRLKIELGTVTYREELIPLELIAPSDIADALINDLNLQVGDCLAVDYEVYTEVVGAPKKQRAVGRASKVQSGFTKTEYLIIGADEPFSEEHELFITDEELEKLKEEREIMKAEKMKEKSEQDSTPKSSGGLKSRRSPSASRSTAGRASTASRASSGRTPF